MVRYITYYLYRGQLVSSNIATGHVPPQPHKGDVVVIAGTRYIVDHREFVFNENEIVTYIHLMHT